METAISREHTPSQDVASGKARSIAPGVVYNCLLVAAGTLAYLNSLKAPFIFDNIYDVAENVSIRRIWPLWPLLFGKDSLARPLVELSLAINYAISGLDTWSYHVFNLIIHLFAGLTLMAIVRRTLLMDPLSKRFGARSSALAFAVACIWLVHPIQTASVTNIIQRCESMMGLFYLLTLYAFIRGVSAPARKGFGTAGSRFWPAGSRFWYAGAIAACLAGMMCKQVMVTAPLMVFAYDVLFVSKSYRQALRSRWPLYAGLLLTWVPLAAINLAAPHNQTAGFAVASVRPLAYFESEFKVVCYYIEQSIWPNSLCMDYLWPVATSVGQILPYGFLIVALVAATVWAFFRGLAISFLGIWFFGILSVTSSFMPFTDLAFDHRMYLPLAGVVAVVVIGGVYVIDEVTYPGRILQAIQPRASFVELVLCSVVIACLTLATVRRNIDYQYPIAMWQDVIRKSPNNPRAYGSLGLHLIDAGRLDEAVSVLNQALRLKPGYVGAEAYLGRALVLQGHPQDAEPHLLFVLHNQPDHSAANLYLGRVLLAQGRADQAIDYLDKSITVEPTYAEAHFYYGEALSRLGRDAEAAEQYAITSRLAPGLVEALRSADQSTPATR